MRKPNCTTCRKYKERVAIVLESTNDTSDTTTINPRRLPWSHALNLAHAAARKQCCHGCEGENGIGLFDTLTLLAELKPAELKPAPRCKCMYLHSQTFRQLVKHPSYENFRASFDVQTSDYVEEGKLVVFEPNESMGMILKKMREQQSQCQTKYQDS